MLMQTLIEALLLLCLQCGNGMEVLIELQLDFLTEPSLICGTSFEGCIPALTSTSSLSSNKLFAYKAETIAKPSNDPQRVSYQYNITTGQPDQIPLIASLWASLTLQCPKEACGGRNYSSITTDTFKVPGISSQNISSSHLLTFRGLNFSLVEATATVTYTYQADPENSFDCTNGNAEGKCPVVSPFFCPIFADTTTPVPCYPESVDESCIESPEPPTTTTTTNSVATSTLTSSTSTVTTGVSAVSTQSSTSISAISFDTRSYDMGTSASTRTTLLSSRQDSSNPTMSPVSYPTVCTEGRIDHLAMIALAVITGLLLIAVITVSVLHIRLRKTISKPSPAYDSAEEMVFGYPHQNLSAHDYDIAKSFHN